MADIQGKIAAYRPSKTVWFWSTAGAVVVTLILGFTWGGWVTGGAAADRAEEAAEGAAARLAADICAYRFLQAGDAGTQLAALKEQASYKRNALIEDGGWVTFAGAEDPVRGAAGLCVDHLMEAKLETPATTPVVDTTAASAAAS